MLLQLQSLAVPNHVLCRQMPCAALLDALRSHKAKLYAGATVTELHMMDDKGKASTVVCLRLLIWVEEDPFTGSCLATTTHRTTPHQTGHAMPRHARPHHTTQWWGCSNVCRPDGALLSFCLQHFTSTCCFQK